VRQLGSHRCTRKLDIVGMLAARQAEATIQTMVHNDDDNGAQSFASNESTPVFEKIGDGVVVCVDGYEVEWGDYVDGISDESRVLGFWSANGWGSESVEAYLVAPSIIVISHDSDGDTGQTLHENVANVGKFALDRFSNNEMTIAIAADVYGPLFDGNTFLPTPRLPMTVWEEGPFADGNDGEEDPQLFWGGCTGAMNVVFEEFRRRVDAGKYPIVSELKNVGSEAWRRWAVGLLTAKPLEDGVLADGYPLVRDANLLANLSTEKLLEIAAGSLARLRG